MKIQSKLFSGAHLPFARSFVAFAAALLCGFVHADVTWGSADAVGTAVSSSGANPYVGLIDRGDGTYALVFTNAQETTFTFNSAWAVKEFLVVGGGGAGGGNVGAGGGGGGVIYFTEELLAANAATDNTTTNFENGGRISITIGAGGVSGFKMKGTPGGHSMLTLGEKTYTAFGGGGGGDYGDDGTDYWISPDIPDDGNAVPGAGGNTGCGAGVYGGKKGTNGYKTSMPVLTGDTYGSNGYYGTDGGDNNGDNACGGGGGAGTAGSKASSTSKGGNGGDGLPCSITGTEVYYAAGGGGGDNNQSEKDSAKRPQGGRGGGGHASVQVGRASPATSTRPSEGTDATGFGCGGGGGVGGQNGTATGGNGSAGIVVLLIEPLSLTLTPAVEDIAIHSATIGATVAKIGVDATKADVYFAFGESADNLGEYRLVSGDGLAEGGVWSQSLTGLACDTEYFYSFVATNNASPAEDVKVDGSFTTPPLAPPSIADVTVEGAARRADITLTLDVGDDVDSAFLMVAYGTNASALNKTNVINAAATSGQVSFTIEGIFDTAQYYCSFIATNELGFVTATGNFPFKATSPTSAPRLWVGGGTAQADGSLRWDDHRNWKDGIVPKDGEAVHFPDNTTAKIEMPAWAFASTSGNAEFAISNNCDIVLVKSSEVDEDLQYRFAGKVSLPESSSLTLSGSHVWFSHGTASYYKFEGDLTVTDGAYFQLSADGLVISNNLVTVEKKSKFGLKNKIVLAGETQFILDDSELLSEGGSRQVTFRNTATLEFKGKSPFANIYLQGANVEGYEPHLIFTIPAGGYDRIPLVNSSSSKIPGDDHLINFTVANDSPVFASAVAKVVPLVVSTNYIHYSNAAKSKVELDPINPPEGTGAEWVYRENVLTDADVTAGTYDERNVWFDAADRSVITNNAVKTLGVYIQGPVSYPVFNLPTIVPDIHTAAVEVTLRTLGVGATSADVYVACGTDVDNLGDYTLVKEGAVLSDVIQTSLTGLDYGTDYYCVLLATNDLDPAQSGATTNRFRTLPAEVMAISGPTATPGKGISDFSVTVDKLGEGASSVEISLIWGTSSGNLDRTNLVASAATLGKVDYRLYELQRSAIQYYYAFVATNGLGQVASTVTNGFKTVSGSVDCLWSGEGEQQADGSYRWDDYRNWASGTAPIAGDKICFSDGAEVTIEMPAAAFTSGGEFAVGNNCKIVLKKSSEVDADLEYKFTGKVTLPETSTLTLSGCHVWFSSTTLSNYQFAGDLTVTDGAYFQLSAADNFVLSNNLITVEKKSKFGLPSKNITLAGETNFILDDSEFVSEGGSRTVTFKNTATLVFKGKSPYANIFVKGNGANYTPHLLFNIPQGGYDRIPLVNSHSTGMPNAAVVYCAIDSQSPAYSQSIDKVVPLIVSTNAVSYSKSSTNMLLDEIDVPTESEAAWVYRADVLSDADVAAGTYDARDAWSDAEPRSAVAANAVKTLGVYIKGSGEAQLTLSGGTVEPEKTSASVSVKVAWLGEGADAAEVSVIWGESADTLVNTNVLESAAVAGQVCNGTITGLSAETTYSYAFTATNGLGQTVTTTPATFTTLAPEALTLADASATAQKTSAEVSVTVSLLGEGATGADVYFAYGPSAGELGTPALVKSGATANETVTAQVSGLMPETTYDYAFSATNNAMPAQFADLAGSFTTLSPDRITLSGLTAQAGSNGKSFTATVSVGSLGSGTDPKVSLQYRETGTESWLVAGTNDLAAVGDSEFSVTLAETVADETTFDLRAIASMTEAGVVYASTSTVSQVTLVPPDVPFGADPVIRNGEVSVDGGTVRVPYSVEWAGEGKETCSVELAYGLAADDLCFTNEVGSALFGAGTAELANLAPGRTYYMQFTADNGDTKGSTAVFAVTIPADGVFPTTFAEGQAVIAGLGANFLVVDGTNATYSGTFANYVEGAAVTLHYSTDGETWETHSATVTADGFSGSLENLVSGTYSYYLTAELDDSTVDRTPEKTVATNGGTTLNSAITVGTAIHAITVKFTVSKLGSGSTRTGIVMANMAGAWTEVYSQAQTGTGSPTYTFDGSTIFDFATAYDLKVVARDTSADGTVVWENSTATAQFKAVDTTARTYTWTGAGEDDLWNNPANWSVSPTATSAAGYPATENSVVLFPADVVATVLVSRAEVAKVVNVQAAEHVYIKGGSDDASITCQYFRFGTPNEDKQSSGNGGSFDLVLDGITVTETEAFSADNDTSPTLSIARKNHHHMGDGASLTLTNGTVFNSKGNWTPYGDNKGAKNVSIVIEKGSSFNLATCWIPDQEEYKVYGFYLGHDQSRLVLDDTKMTVDGNFVLNDIASSQQPDGSDFLVFKGTNPVLRVTETMVVSDASRMPTTIEFHMPSAGYAESPIQIEKNTAPFPLKTAGAAVTPLTLSIIPPDPEDPSSLKFGEAPLVSSAAGFDPNYIKLSPETEKLCQLVFEGENAAGYPTTLRVARRGSTYLLK